MMNTSHRREEIQENARQEIAERGKKFKNKIK